MRRKILSLAMAGVLGAALTVVAATPAHAVPAPNTSPAPALRVFQSNADFLCADGYVCATVPYGSGFYIFKFYNYGTYYLSNWFGVGIVFNNQTGGAAARLRNSSGAQLQCIRGQIDGVAHFDDYVPWDPIWRIQLTSSTC